MCTDLSSGTIAAGIHADVGNVVAGSLFATGYGAAIIFGGVWAGTFVGIIVMAKA
jgi:hypothetical protein